MAWISWNEWLVEKIAGQGLSNRYRENVLSRDFERQMRQKLLSAEPSEVAIGSLGLKQIASAEHISSASTQPKKISGFQRPHYLMVLPSGRSSEQPSKSPISSPGSSNRLSTSSGTKSIGSSQTSLDSPAGTSLENAVCRRIGSWDTSVLPFPISRPTQWILRPANCQPRLSSYWPEDQQTRGAKENNRRWLTHIGTPWEGYCFNETTFKYEKVPKDMASCPMDTRKSKNGVSWDTIGGDRYKCYKHLDKSSKMKHILEKMSDIADICGSVGLDLELYGFDGITYHDLLCMKYTEATKKIYRTPSVEISPNGMRIVRGFGGPLDLNKTEQAHGLLVAHPYSAIDLPFRPTVTAVHAHHRIPDGTTPTILVSESSTVEGLLRHQYEYGSLGLGKGIGIQKRPEPLRFRRVPRKWTRLERLRPIGPKGPGMKRSAMTRRVVRVRDPDAERKAKWGISPREGVEMIKDPDDSGVSPRRAKRQSDQSSRAQDFTIHEDDNTTPNPSQKVAARPCSSSRDSWQTDT